MAREGIERRLAAILSADGGEADPPGDAAVLPVLMQWTAPTRRHLVHRLIRNVHEGQKYANVSKRLEPDQMNHSSVSVH